MTLTRESCALVLDSTADFPDGPARFPNLRIVPLTVRFGTEELRDYVDLGPEDFYRRLAAGDGPHPTTSQPSPQAFADVYRELLGDGGYEHVVSLHISGKLSGTVRSAQLAAEEWPGQVSVLDSQTGSIGIALAALRIEQLLAAGSDAPAIADYVAAYAERHHIVFAVESLDCLIRGGRVGKAAGAVGQLLSLRPLLGVADGEVVALTRVRGAGKLLGAIEKELTSTTEPDQPLRVGIACSTDASIVEPVRAMLARVRPQAVVELVGTLGPVVGTYTGPGSFGVLWVAEEPV